MLACFHSRSSFCSFYETLSRCNQSINQSLYLNTWHLGVPKFSFKRVRVLEIHPTQPRGGHPSHSNLVRGKLTSPTPNPAGDGTSGLTSYPRRRSKVSEATCLRPQRSAPSRTWTRAVRPKVQRSDHWATHASPCVIGCAYSFRILLSMPWGPSALDGLRFFHFFNTEQVSVSQVGVKIWVLMDFIKKGRNVWCIQWIVGSHWCDQTVVN